MWHRRVAPVTNMANTCPDCGASMEFEQHDVRLRTGVCPSCANEFAFVEGHPVSSRFGADAPEGAAEPNAGGATTPVPAGGPECEECGSPLSIRSGRHGSLEVACEECETVTLFVPKPEGQGAPRGRAPSFEGGAPRGRPCRQCGAPLRFSTGEDGLLVGECEACGNRFTLPPRTDRPGRGRDFGGPRRYGGGDFRRAGGRPPFRGSDRRDRGGFDDRERPRKRRRPRDE